jgi:hypothetical protein
MTLNDYFEQWFEDYAKFHHSPGWQTADRQMYRDFVAPLIGKRELKEIRVLEIQKILSTMIDKGMAKSYGNRYPHTDSEYLKQKCKVLDLYANSAQIPPTPLKTALRLVNL